jgi:hypothetical protein
MRCILVLVAAAAVMGVGVSGAKGSGGCFDDPSAASCADSSVFYPDADINMVRRAEKA